MAQRPPETEGLRLDIRERIATITLDRPRRLNTMTPAMGRALFTVVDYLNNEDDVRAVILTGAGDRAFSAGSDVTVLDDYGTNWQLRNRVDYARAIWAIRKPAIAQISGWCIGGGLEMALMCDIRVADTTARLGAGEIKLGWHGGAGNTQLLPRIAGWGRAAEMLLTGDPIGASEALACRLIDHVVDPAQLHNKAFGIAERIARNAPIAAQLGKHLLRVAASSSLDVGLAYENDTFAYLFTTADAAEGRAAFAAKRNPDFRGA